MVEICFVTTYEICFTIRDAVQTICMSAQFILLDAMILSLRTRTCQSPYPAIQLLSCLLRRTLYPFKNLWGVESRHKLDNSLRRPKSRAMVIVEMVEHIHYRRKVVPAGTFDAHQTQVARLYGEAKYMRGKQFPPRPEIPWRTCSVPVLVEFPCDATLFQHNKRLVRWRVLADPPDQSNKSRVGILGSGNVGSESFD